MSDPRHGFGTHRCAGKPKGYSLRDYGGCWHLSRHEIDPEWCDEYLGTFAEGVRFCPWCGGELGEHAAAAVQAVDGNQPSKRQ